MICDRAGKHTWHLKFKAKTISIKNNESNFQKE